MPRVQRLERRVAPTIGGGERVQLPSPDTGIEARFLGQVGKALTGVAGRGMDVEAREEEIALKRREEEDKLRKKQQGDYDESMATKAYNEYLIITSNHDDELLTRKGYDTKTISGDMAKMVEPEYKRLSQGLDNDSQRYLFESAAASHAYTRKRQYDSYRRKEISKATQKGAESIIANISTFAITNYTDPDALKKAISDIDIHTERALPGAGAAEKKAFKDAAISDIHSGRVKMYLADDNVEGAIGYFNGVQDKILPEDRIPLKKSLDRNETVENAQKLVDAVVAEFDQSEWKKHIRELSTGAEEKEAMRLINVRIDDDERIKKEQHDEFMASKIRDIRAAKTLARAFRIANSAQKDEDKTALEDIAQRFFDTKAKRVEKIETDSRVKNNLYTAIDNGTIDTIDQIYEFASGKAITNKDIDGGISYLKQGGNLGALSYSSIMAVSKGLGFDPDLEDEEEVRQLNAIYDYVEYSFRSTGKSPKDIPELRKVISNAIATTPQTGVLFRSPGQMFSEAFAAGTVDQWIVDFEVPTDPKEPFNRNYIIDRLKAENLRALAAGEEIIDIDSTTVKEYYLINKLGLIPPDERISGDIQVPSPIPVTPALAPTPAAPAEVPAEKIEPFRGTATTATAEEIRGVLKGEGTEISERDAMLLEVEQYPESVKRPIQSILENEEISDVQKRKMIKKILEPQLEKEIKPEIKLTEEQKKIIKKRAIEERLRRGEVPELEELEEAK